MAPQQKTGKINKYIANRASSILLCFLQSLKKEKTTFLLPTNICKEVPKIFEEAKKKVVFIDIEKKNWEIDIKKCKKELQTNNIHGILYNHTYGNEYTPIKDLKALKALQKKLIIIDDRCLCAPHKEVSPTLNTEIFDLIIYSTGYAKQTDLKQGGQGYSKKHFKLDEKYMLQISDEKYLEEIHNHIQRYQPHKKNLRNIYENLIKKDLKVDMKYNNWRYNILCANKEIVLEKIFEADLYASSHYKPMRSNHKNATALHNAVINLFIDMHYDKDKTIKTINIINKYAKPIK